MAPVIIIVLDIYLILPNSINSTISNISLDDVLISLFLIPSIKFLSVERNVLKVSVNIKFTEPFVPITHKLIGEIDLTQVSTFILTPLSKFTNNSFLSFFLMYCDLIFFLC